MQASTKEEFKSHIDRFLTPETADKPMIFEVFTTTEGESGAIQIMRTFLNDNKTIIKNKIMGSVRVVLGKKGIETIKRLTDRY